MIRPFQYLWAQMIHGTFSAFGNRPRNLRRRRTRNLHSRPVVRMSASMVELLETRQLLASSPLSTVPNVTNVTLDNNSSATPLKDTASLAGQSFVDGSITFTLVHAGTTVHTETVPVNGNSPYTTPVGYTLPSTGTVTGFYQWNATYNEGNGVVITDNNNALETVNVTAASPKIVTTASPAVTLGATPPTLSDSALLSGGFNETGSIVFTLTAGQSSVNPQKNQREAFQTRLHPIRRSFVCLGDFL